MRELEKIENDIEVITQKISRLSAQRKVLIRERDERMFADFCEKYGVRKGDVVRTIYNGDFVICGMSNFYDHIEVRHLNMQKSPLDDGPFDDTATVSQEIFSGCKVIGHIDDSKFDEQYQYWKKKYSE